MTAHSNSYTTSSLNVVCNDIPDWLRALAQWYPYFKYVDLTQGVPYGRCKRI